MLKCPSRRIGCTCSRALIVGERLAHQKPRRRSRYTALMESTSALRQRKCRARRRQGTVVLHVEAHEFRLIDALLASGRLSEDESQRRGLVEKAAARLLEDFAQRWLGKQRSRSRAIAHAHACRCPGRLSQWWLHRPTGARCYRHRARQTTGSSTPRSMASIRPHGPAPMITTAQSRFSVAVPRLHARRIVTPDEYGA
jgi:hypothetical protein